MMIANQMLVPSEGGTSSSGTSSSALTNPNRVALNVSFTSMTASVGSPPPPSNHGHLQGSSGGGHQHPSISHHPHHHSDGPNPENRYGLFSEKMESFQGIGPGLGSVGGVASASSEASSSSSSGVLWQSHEPSIPLNQNAPPQHLTHLPNENDDLKISQATGMVQRCESSNSSAAMSGQLNGHQHPDILPPGYIEHHQKVRIYKIKNRNPWGNIIIL